MRTTPANPPLSLLLVELPAHLRAVAVGTGFALREAADAGAARQHDAVLFAAADAAALALLAQRADLLQAARDSAVVLLCALADDALEAALLGQGVQAIVAPADAPALARAIRHAVARKRAERVARTAYATDLATGLPHQAQLLEHMTQLLALREREPAAMAVLVLAIDGLGATEARLGAEAANVLRRKVAVRLRSGLRASDVVAALGGDSFAVLLAWIDDAEDAERVSGKLASSLQRPFSVAGQDVAVAVRLGVAQYPGQGRDADTLLRLARARAGDAAALGRAGLTPGGAGRAANDD